MVLDEVSLVASGDDPEAKVVIAKSAHQTPRQRELAEKIRRRRTKKSQPDEETTSTLTIDDLSQEDQMPDINQDDLPEEVVNYISELEGSVDEMIAAISSLDDDDESYEDEIVDEDERELAEVGKSDSVTISKADHQALIYRVEQAEQIAKAERDARKRSEAIAKADSMTLSVDRDQLVDLLFDLERIDSDIASRVESVLTAASEQLQKSALFSEVGKSTVEFASTSSLQSAADEIAKSEPSLTQEMAFAKALEQNPDLYDQYLKDGAR